MKKRIWIIPMLMFCLLLIGCGAADAGFDDIYHSANVSSDELDKQINDYSDDSLEPSKELYDKIASKSDEEIDDIFDKYSIEHDAQGERLHGSKLLLYWAYCAMLSFRNWIKFILPVSYLVGIGLVILGKGRNKGLQKFGITVMMIGVTVICVIIGFGPALLSSIF